MLEELIKKGIIRENQTEEIRNRANEKYQGNIEEVLSEMGVTEEDILKAKGDYFGVPTRKIEKKEIPFSILKYISEDSARFYNFVPLDFKEGILEVGIVDPGNIQAMDALQFIVANSGIPFKIFIISEKDYQGIMKSYEGLSNEVEEAVGEFNEETLEIKENKISGEKEIEKEKMGQEEKIIEDAPVIKIVTVILRNAIEGNASDVHIEHTGEKVKVRYRVDGSLHTTITLPLNVYNGVVARIKILAKLRLDEKRKPQDGSFSANIEGRKIDFRVSTMPAFFGEKVVLRVLDSKRGVEPIDQLGLSKRNLELVREAINKPYGLILITGPTGSGKSTTLYSIMNELDKEGENIISLEDPVEYHIPDVNQSQMRPEIGYTFATGLRSILRQDPDIIMVGEIRDKETAQLAVQAALTGHLVFSTLHTNNAVGAIPRLIDMGVDPYLIAPTLILLIAQRLAKMTYPTCRKSVPMDESIKLQIENQIKDLPEKYKAEIKLGAEMYDTVPSSECPTGTRGRIAIYEMFKIDKEMQDIILKNPVNSVIYKAARNKGMLTMKEDAMLKAIEGVIPYREVYNFSDEKD